MVPSRLKIANTWSPEKPQLLLAIHVFNEHEAEKRLHDHFRKHRLNGEWFEINFATAFRALLDLNIVPDVSQPVLELPVVPPIHPDFRRWYVGVDWRTMSPDASPYLPSPAQVQNDPDALRGIDANIEDLWERHYRKFEEDFAKHSGDVDAMIAEHQLLSVEQTAQVFEDVRKMLKNL